MGRRTRSEPNRAGARARLLEDLLSVLVALALAVAGLACVAAGLAARDATLDRARAEAADTQATPAALLADATPVPGAAGPERYRAPVGWTGRDGVARTGTAAVAVPWHAGDPVTVWTGRDGRLVRTPLTPSDAVAAGVLTGLMAAVPAGLLVAGAAAAGFGWTGRRLAGAWEQEWAEVEPTWSGRSRR
ncbi:hypothetical protein [Pseudonocardia spirodelae]|uniref:Integral membrane protein n=1 Tax=Pseudonocardia spirodelae TaxID=3133431 RepID=A0ABU8TCM6_9PSEU